MAECARAPRGGAGQRGSEMPSRPMHSLNRKKLEATPGFEPGVKALQASALPLGHVAISNFQEKGAGHSIDRPRVPCGADNGVRTRDPHLGKVVLYQLSHVRIAWNILLEES